MQLVMRYHVPFKKSPEFKGWLLENKKVLADNQLEGWTHLGTWFTVRFLGHFPYETRWEIDDYDALGAGWGNETLQNLMREWLEFVDLDRDHETYLMKSAADISIFE